MYLTNINIVSTFVYKLINMKKRYQILKNNQLLVEVDSMVEMYLSIGMSRQHYHQSKKGLTQFTYLGDEYKIIDKLENIL